MLSLNRCRELLGDYGQTLTHEELKQLRDLLYTLGYIDFTQHQKNHENRDPLHPGIDRGAT